MASRLTFAALIVATLACDSPSAPAPALASFQVSAGASSGHPPAKPAVESARGRVTITAELNTPTPCYTLAGNLDSDGGEIRLLVRARAAEQAVCVLVIGRFAYTATIALRAGTYTLVIVHEYPGTGWPTTEVLRERIRVE